MKRNLINLIIIFMMTLVPSLIHAGTQSSYTVKVNKTQKRSKHNEQLDEEGRRMPPAPLICNISLTLGVEIPGLDEEIQSYEVWDISSESCLASFSAEVDFLDYLFTQSGNFIIQFDTENYSVRGDILLE